MIKAGYKNNEWLAVYNDENGDRQIMPFDTFEQATEYLGHCYSKIGVMTIWFYNANIENVLEEDTDLIDTVDEDYDEPDYDDGSSIGCGDCPDDECTGHCMGCAYRPI